MPQSTVPQFLYFDLGNVLAYFDHQRAVNRLSELSQRDPEVIDRLLFHSDWQVRYESGDVTSEQFCAMLRRELECSTPDAELRDACSDIFTLNSPIVPLIAQLATAGHRLGILSNTCEAHWEWVTRDRYRIVPDYFSEIVCSYQVRAMKPDPAIFEHAVRRVELSPEQVFFVDDRDDNVLGARQAGLDAVPYRGIQPLIRDLMERGIEANF